MKFKGYTLIELVITLSVLSILTLIIISSSDFFVRTNEKQMIIDEIRTAVQMARTEAVSVGLRIVLEPYNGERDWSNGVSISRYNKKTNSFESFYQHRWHHPRWLISWSGIKPGNQIQFSDNPVDAISNGHFQVSNRYEKKTTTLVLNRLGRLRVEDVPSK